MKCIVIMQINKNADEEQCFQGDSGIEVSIESNSPLPAVLMSLKNDLPANQLHSVRRPQSFIARTLFTTHPFYLLKDVLMDSCLQITTPVTKCTVKPDLPSADGCTLQHIFALSDYQLLYDKIKGEGYTGRYRTIDVLADYNWKMFKELQSQNIDKQLECDEIDADFECGNICKVYEKQKIFYLLIENDLNTHGYNNWFFYRLRTKKRGIKQFRIMNFVKKNSFYEQNMLVSIFSMEQYKTKGVKWFKGGNNICFQKTQFSRESHYEESYYSLCFEYDNTNESDEIYFAYSQPYTYTRLSSFLKILQSPLIQVKHIGYSIANNIIPYVRFFENETKAKKPVIVFFARQHPCETVGSFIIEHIMQALKDRNAVSDRLLNRFDIIIIPMINPDGVIHGTSRCNLSGLDLNRQWGSDAIKQLTPETMKVRQFLLSLSSRTTIKYFIDLHGHGKRLNSFFFACKGDNTRLLSMVMNKIQPRFDIYSCTYGITRDKEKTIRSQMHGLGVSQSYTLQSSLYGWSDGLEIRHYNESDYKEIGQSLLKSLFCIDFESSVVQNVLNVTKESIQSEYSLLLPKLMKQESKHANDNEMMSESDPQGDGLRPQEMEHICKNVNLRKRFTVSAVKFEAKKKQQKSSRKKTHSTYRLQNRSVRESGHVPHIEIVEYKQEESNTEIRNVEAKNGKKMIEKWKEKRRFITEKLIKEAEMKETKMEKNQMNYTMSRNNIQSMRKIKYFLTDDKPKSKIAKKNKTIVKMKTFESVPKEQENKIKDQQIQRMKLDKKIQQVKNESISMLLANTLTIFKSKRPQRYDNKKQKELKKSYRCYTQERVQKVFHNNSKYHKFKKFMQQQPYKKQQLHTNSVFYYFPIL